MSLMDRKSCKEKRQRQHEGLMQKCGGKKKNHRKPLWKAKVGTGPQTMADCLKLQRSSCPLALRPEKKVKCGCLDGQPLKVNSVSF